MYNRSQEEAKERCAIKRALRKVGIAYQADESTANLKAKLLPHHNPNYLTSHPRRELSAPR